MVFLHHLPIDQDVNLFVSAFEFKNPELKTPTYENDNRMMFPWNARKNYLNYFLVKVK